MDADGIERALHEWEIDMDLDAHGHVAAVAARPRSLPFSVCPSVMGGLDALVGTPLGHLRVAVSEQLAGVAGCTHLNDLLGVLPASVTAADE